MVLLADLRHAARALRRRPGFALVAVSTLGLGIGAATTVFALVNGVLFRPLPFPQPERLVAIWETAPPGVVALETSSVPTFDDWRRASRAVNDWAAWRDWSFSMKSPSGPESILGGIATAGFFDVLGVSAARGRTFSPADDQPGAEPVLVISDALWRERFGGDPSIVGRVLTFGTRRPGARDEQYRVVGVLPRALRVPFAEEAQAWAPTSVDPDNALGMRGLRNRRVIGRLAPGVSLAQARSELSLLARATAIAHADSNRGWGAAIARMDGHEVRGVRQQLLLLLGAVVFVLLVVCANLGALLLSRGTERQHEVAVRAALGARPLALARALAAESLVLGLAGGVVGLGLGIALLGSVKRLAPFVPRLQEVGPDAAVVAFSLLVALAASVLFGVVPALQASRVSLVTQLSGGGRGQVNPRGTRARSVLVVGEFALAVTLLAGAGLIARSFVRLVTQDPGFDTVNLLTVGLSPSLDRYPEGEDVAALYERLRQDVAALPGVRSVAAVSAGPLFGGLEPVELETSAPAGGVRLAARFFNATPDYFRTLGVPIRRGREFGSRDTASSPPVAVVNETLARRAWPGLDPLGRRLKDLERERDVEVVGVVGDVVKDYRPGATVEPEIYWPYAQAPRWATFLVVRASGRDAGLPSAIRSRIASADPDLFVGRTAWIDERIARATRAPRFSAWVIGGFALLAVVLAAVGVYGLLSYTAGLRAREIAVRLTLGASPRGVLLRFLADGLRLAAAGGALGLLAAIGLSRTLEGLLFGISRRDPSTLLAAIGVLAITAVVATVAPARRAARVDPVVMLRGD